MKITAVVYSAYWSCGDVFANKHLRKVLRHKQWLTTVSKIHQSALVSVVCAVSDLRLDVGSHVIYMDICHYWLRHTAIRLQGAMDLANQQGARSSCQYTGALVWALLTSVCGVLFFFSMCSLFCPYGCAREFGACNSQLVSQMCVLMITGCACIKLVHMTGNLCRYHTNIFWTSCSL